MKSTQQHGKILISEKSHISSCSHNFMGVIYMHKDETVMGTVWIVGLVELFYLGINISF